MMFSIFKAVAKFDKNTVAAILVSIITVASVDKKKKLPTLPGLHYKSHFEIKVTIGTQ